MQLSAKPVDVIVAWIESKRSIKRAWLFGSRAKGNARADSDIDIALQLMPSDGEALAEWIENAQQWQVELDEMIGPSLEVDLEAAFDNDEIVMPAVNEHGILLFERTQA